MRTKDFWNFVAAEAGDSSPEFTVTIYIGSLVLCGIIRVRGYGSPPADTPWRSCWLSVYGVSPDVFIDISVIDLIHKGEPVNLNLREA